MLQIKSSLCKQIWIASICMALALPAYGNLPTNSLEAQTHMAEANPYQGWVVSKALLFETNQDDEKVALCEVTINGQEDLVPSFAPSAPEGFQSSLENFGLPTCNANELDAIAEIALSSVNLGDESVQLAFLPLVVPFMGGLVFCGYLAVGGAAIVLTRDVEGLSKAGIVLSGIGLALAYPHGAAAALGFVGAGFICGGSGAGVQYLIEKEQDE